MKRLYTRPLTLTVVATGLVLSIAACGPGEEPDLSPTTISVDVPNIPTPEETEVEEFTDYAWSGCNDHTVNLQVPQGWQVQAEDYAEKNIGIQGLVISDAQANSVIIGCSPQENATLDLVKSTPVEDLIPAPTDEKIGERTVSPGQDLTIGESAAYRYTASYASGVTQDLRIAVLDEATPASSILIISGTTQVESDPVVTEALLDSIEIVM
jgi:hypothetical protein